MLMKICFDRTVNPIHIAPFWFEVVMGRSESGFDSDVSDSLKCVIEKSSILGTEVNGQHTFQSMDGSKWFLLNF